MHGEKKRILLKKSDQTAINMKCCQDDFIMELISDTFSCQDVCTTLMQRVSNSKLSLIWISGLICPLFSYPFN